MFNRTARKTLEQVAFDAEFAELARDIGMAWAIRNRVGILEKAQAIARVLARRRVDRRLTIDPVIGVLVAMGHDPRELGPASGAVFRGADWRFTGEWKKSRRVSNHARAVRIWELREEREFV